MAYDLTCPYCQTRLLLKDEAGEEYLLCPRCLNMVPRPSPSGPAQNPAGTPTSITALPSRSTRSVPSVESEVKSSIWIAYFIILAVTLLAVAGAFRLSECSAAFFALVGVLTIVILYPIGRGLFWATAAGAPENTALRTVWIVVVLAVLAPIAFFIVLFIGCAAILGGRPFRLG